MHWFDAIPWIISALSLLFVVLTFAKNSKKDEKIESEKVSAKFEGIKDSLLKANLKLDQVCATTNETRSDIKAMDARMQVLDKELAIVKRDLKTAFTRIDELKAQGGGTNVKLESANEE